MRRILLVLLAAQFLPGVAGAQSLRLKSNSAKKYHVTATGLNKEGQQITRQLDDVSLGYWKTVSLYKTKYGYDMYNNKQMKREGGDATNRWQTLTIVEDGTGKTDVLDITRPVTEQRLANNRTWVKIKQSWDSDYLLTYVLLYDHRKFVD
ncbi:MAG: hypothetical protein H7257_13215 [Taibaiella sp.]|nr:hypothetical protein [Taibaiella sp.]